MSTEPTTAASNTNMATTPPEHAHEIIAPRPADILAAEQPSEGVVAHYVGGGYHVLSGLPGRDLTEADFAGSGWTLEVALSVAPPVYVRPGDEPKAAPTSAISQAPDRPAGA